MDQAKLAKMQASVRIGTFDFFFLSFLLSFFAMHKLELGAVDATAGVWLAGSGLELETSTRSTPHTTHHSHDRIFRLCLLQVAVALVRWISLCRAIKTHFNIHVGSTWNAIANLFSLQGMYQFNFYEIISSTHFPFAPPIDSLRP
jgi:hypothetical protein